MKEIFIPWDKIIISKAESNIDNLVLITKEEYKKLKEIEFRYNDLCK